MTWTGIIDPDEYTVTATGDVSQTRKLPRKIRYLYICAHNTTAARGAVYVSLSFQQANYIVGGHLPSHKLDPLIVEIPGELPVNEATLTITYEDCLLSDVLRTFISYEYEV
jgi:hypothetical protein